MTQCSYTNCFDIGFHISRLCSGCCVNDSSFWGLTTCQSVVEGYVRFVRLDSQGFQCYWQRQRWKSSMSTKYANQVKYDQLKINIAHHPVESNPTFEFMHLWQGIPWPTRSRPNGHRINAESFLNYLARVARPHRTRLLARFGSSWSSSKSLASWTFACISTRVSVQVLMCPQAGTIPGVYQYIVCIVTKVYQVYLFRLKYWEGSATKTLLFSEASLVCHLFLARLELLIEANHSFITCQTMTTSSWPQRSRCPSSPTPLAWATWSSPLLRAASQTRHV